VKAVALIAGSALGGAMAPLTGAPRRMAANPSDRAEDGEHLPSELRSSGDDGFPRFPIPQITKHDEFDFENVARCSAV
jgi:hypothetical protein